MPRVSILLTSYNHEKYIKESVESVLAQTFDDFELLIVDDHSVDSSFDIIESINDKRITAIRNVKNNGPEYAFEILHNTANCEYVAIADSDNVWEKDKLEKQVRFLDSHPEYTAVFTRASIIDENGDFSPIGSDPARSIFEVKNRSRQEWLNHFFYKGNCLCHPSILIRREAYEECNMKVRGMWQGPDLYKWIRLCIKHEIYILDDRLIRFRMHKHNISGPGNLSSVLRGSNELYQIYNLFYEITEDDFPLVFKEASQYTVNGEINIKFALSKLLLELEIPAAKTLGLNKLFELINSKESREQILRLYQYDDVSYKIDETNNSPYVLKCWSNSLSVCNAKLYYDYGDGFSEDNFSVNDVITDAAGNYYVEFTDIAPFINKKGLVGIRFDPCEFCAKIKIDGIEADGKKLDFELNKKNYGDGQYISHNGYDVFYIDDPSYIVKGVESGVSKIEVYGKLYELSIYEALDLNNRVTLAKALENFEKNQNILVRMTIKLTRAIKAVLRKPYHAIKRLFKRS